MSDLIERLRNEPNDFDTSHLCHESADEIERLRAELKLANTVVEAASALVGMDGLPSAVQFVLLKEALAALDD